MDKNTLLARLVGKNMNKPREIEVPHGPIKVHVEGEVWRSKNIGKPTLNESIKFSLTPKNQYQTTRGWPDGKFYNVNTYPSIETTRSNWLGYVSYQGKPTASEIAKLVNSDSSVSVFGFFELEDGELNAVITIPRKLQS